MRDIARFFVRYQIDPENLLYLTREEQRTVLHLLDGSTVTTSIPQKEIRAWLGDEDFINICKGVTVRKDQIVDISRAGVYTMTDGRTFQGRQRHLAEHKLLRQELMPLSSERGDEAPKSLLKKCTLMDALPLAFCVIGGPRRRLCLPLLQPHDGRGRGRSRREHGKPLVLRGLPGWRPQMACQLCRYRAQRQLPYPARLQPRA